jgi:hypothetical protein
MSNFYCHPGRAGGPPLGVRDSLVAPSQINSPTDLRYGLIGGLFPLIIQGTFKASSTAPTIDFSATISSVTVSISSSGIQPGITIEGVSASVNGRSVPAKASNPTISIDLPAVQANGAVHLAIKNLEASLLVEDGGSTTAVSIGSAIRDALNAAQPFLATVSPSFTLALPQCIAMNNPRFQALSPCVDYHNATVGFISRASGPGPVTYSVNFSKTRITTLQGEIEIDFSQ